MRYDREQGETTYSGPTSLLPELLKAPLRTASGLRGLSTSTAGPGDRTWASMGAE